MDNTCMNEEKAPLDPPYNEVPPPYSVAAADPATAASAPPPSGFIINANTQSPHPYPQLSQPLIPQPGYYGQQHQQQQPFIHPQVVVIQNNPPLFAPDSCRVICQYCQADILTRVRRKNNVTTHLVALFLCLFFCPLFWLPYCMDSCKNTEHECPACGRFLGEYHYQGSYGRRNVQRYY